MVVVLCVGSLVPVAYVVQAAFSFGADALFALMFRPRMGELLTNTVLVLVLSVPCTIVLGVAGAWCVERTRLPARRMFAVLLAAPLAIPAFVSSYAWGSTFGWVEGLGGAVLVSVSAYTPLVYLPVLAALRGLDPAGEEVARSLGLGPWRVFTRVVMPHLRLATLGGALVVALHLLAEYGAFAFLRFETFTTAIVVAYQSTFAGPNPAALGIVLTGLCLLVLAGESVARGHRRYARVGSGSPHPPTLASLGRAAVPTLILMTTFIGVAVIFPLLVVVRWLAAWDSAPLDRMLAAVQGTVTLSLLGAVATVLVALPVVWFAARYPSGASRRLEAAMSVSSSLPVIIVALSLVTLTVRLAPALYQTAFTVVAAYVIVFLPGPSCRCERASPRCPSRTKRWLVRSARHRCARACG